VIFITVGTDGPFDRLVQVVDRWAGETSQPDVFAQIGRSRFQPRHVKCVAFLEPGEFVRHVRSATTVVSHAGTGTILTALHHGKPVLVMPRLAALGERRNDHQLATARHLAKLGKVRVAFDDQELRSQLERLDQLEPCGSVGPFAQPELIAAIRDFIHQPSSARRRS
jgi:exopolysaccharide biosynthesis glucuronosyltransferase PssE